MAQRLMPWAKACLGLWRSWEERRGASSCIWYLLWSLINDVQKSGRRQAQHPDADESREERAIVGSGGGVEALRKVKAFPICTSPSPERRKIGRRALTHCLQYEQR